MRNLRTIVIGLGASLLLIACNDEASETTQKTSDDSESSVENIASSNTDTSDDNEDNDRDEADEDVELTDVEKAQENIDSYEADVHILASVDDGEPETLDINVKRIYADNPEMHLKANGEDSTIHKEGKTYFYNGENWVDISESVEFDQLYRVTYSRAVEVFTELESDLEMSQDDGYFIYEYEGNNSDVSRLMNSLFGVNFGVIDTSNADSEVKFTIDEASNYIEEVVFNSSGEDSEGNFTVESTVSFKSFNEIDEIEAPEVVESE